MINCGECKHWRKIRDEPLRIDDERTMPGPHGECFLLDDYSMDKKAWLYFSLSALDPGKPVENAHVEVSMITQPDFGCAHGEVDTDLAHT